MSKRNIIMCDAPSCGKEYQEGSGEFYTPYDPDFDTFWWQLRIRVFDTPECYDFCTIECLSDWVEERKEEESILKEMPF